MRETYTWKNLEHPLSHKVDQRVAAVISSLPSISRSGWRSFTHPGFRVSRMSWHQVSARAEHYSRRVLDIQGAAPQAEPVPVGKVSWTPSAVYVRSSSGAIPCRKSFVFHLLSTFSVPCLHPRILRTKMASGGSPRGTDRFSKSKDGRRGDDG